MCGLAGLAQSSERFPSRERFAKAVASLRHRGPDSQGLFWAPQDGVALGHVRLSIIDPAARSDQPFHTERCALAFNGEIYNFRWLRAELEATGVAFQTAGDTEVIAQGYAIWGLDVFRRLEGMFAIALFDKQTGELHLARDMFGIKPLYLSALSDGFIFASEIKAIRAMRGLTMDFDTLIDTAIWGYPLSMASAYAGVSQIAPGSVVSLKPMADGWTAASSPSKSTMSFYEGSSKGSAPSLRGALEASVRDHLIADVPVAVALSGGLDSSIVAALAARETSDLTAVTATYADHDDAEVAHARLLCRRYGLRHEVLRLRTDDLESRLRSICHHLEEPIANINALLSYDLSRGVRDTGFKVILMGEGSDELFAGYPWHRFARQSDLRDDPGKLFDAYLRRRGSGRYRTYIQPQALAVAERRAAAQRAEFITEFDVQTSAPLDRFLRFDQIYQMQFSQLQRVDRMFMAHGVEARVPFLYDGVLEASAALGGDEKIWLEGERIRDRSEKIALAEAARDLLPAEILERHKFGAGGTLNLWDTPLMLELPALFEACATADRFRDARAVTSRWIDWDLAGSGVTDPKSQFHLVLVQLCADLFVCSPSESPA